MGSNHIDCIFFRLLLFPSSDYHIHSFDCDQLGKFEISSINHKCTKLITYLMPGLFTKIFVQFTYHSNCPLIHSRQFGSVLDNSDFQQYTSANSLLLFHYPCHLHIYESEKGSCLCLTTQLTCRFSVKLYNIYAHMFDANRFNKYYFVCL